MLAKSLHVFANDKCAFSLCPGKTLLQAFEDFNWFDSIWFDLIWFTQLIGHAAGILAGKYATIIIRIVSS